jgi:hypothetical protein
MTQTRLDVTLDVEYLAYILYAGPDVIYLQGAYYQGSEGHDPTNGFERYLPLFKQIANSFVLYDLY